MVNVDPSYKVVMFLYLPPIEVQRKRTRVSATSIAAATVSKMQSRRSIENSESVSFCDEDDAADVSLFMRLSLSIF